MESKTLTIVLEKDRGEVTVVEKQMKVLSRLFTELEGARDWAEHFAGLYDDTWEITLRESK